MAKLGADLERHVKTKSGGNSSERKTTSCAFTTKQRRTTCEMLVMLCALRDRWVGLLINCHSLQEVHIPYAWVALE